MSNQLKNFCLCYQLLSNCKNTFDWRGKANSHIFGCSPQSSLLVEHNSIRSCHNSKKIVANFCINFCCWAKENINASYTAPQTPFKNHYTPFSNILISRNQPYYYTFLHWTLYDKPVFGPVRIRLLTERVKLCKEGQVAQTVRLQGCQGEVRPRWTWLAGGPICLPKTFSASMHLIKLTACRQHGDRKSDCCVMMNALVSTACHDGG